MINKKNLYIYTIILSLIIFLSASAFSLSNSTGELTFIALGRVHQDYKSLEEAIPLINKENPDFVVFLGDSLSKIEDWQELKKITNILNAPVFFVPGNHDILGSPKSKDYFEKNISPLFQEFTIKNTTFIILNSAAKKSFDISNEQVEFVKSIYNSKNKKVILVHHALFYKDKNQLSTRNSIAISEKSNWNKHLIPLIQENTLAVFTGDSGAREPYFSYIENKVHYFGVGFSSKGNNLLIPQHFLKATIRNNSIKVTPIPINQDLTKTPYIIRTDNTIREKLKSFTINNIRLVYIIFTLSTSILLIIILFLFLKLKKYKIPILRKDIFS